MAELQLYDIEGNRLYLTADDCPTLAELVDRSVAVLREHEPPGGYYGCFSGGKDSAAGFKAAKAGDYATALTHLRAAATANPTDINVTFNRAVAAEAAGQLDEALTAYTAVVAANKKDEVAAACAQRVRRVIAHTRPRVK